MEAPDRIVVDRHPVIDDDRDFAQRTLRGWHLLFAAMLVGAAAFTAAQGNGVRTWPMLALLGLAYAAVWYPPRGCRSTRRTVAYLVVACVLLAGLTWVDPASLVVLFALYPSAFILFDRRGAVLATVAITLTFSLTLMARSGWDRDAVLVNSLTAVGNVVFALVIGLFIDGIVRESRRRKQLLDELRATQGELAALERDAGAAAERERLAQDIHDTLAQGFTSIVVLVQAAENAAARGDGEEVARRLREVEGTARDGLAEARALVGAMSPPALDGVGLPDAVRRIVERFGAESGVETAFRLDGEPGPLAASSDVAALRATQEALANVRRHSGAARVAVLLAYDEDGATVTVSDDGAGFDPSAPRAGYGLDGLTSRIEAVGGIVSVESAPGHGTRVRVRVP